MLSGTVMPIADRIKKLKDGMQAHTYNETGSNPKEVTRTIVEKDGQKKGEFVKVGKEVVESSATQDVKTAGIDLSGDCVCTNPTVLAGNMDDDNVVQDKDDVQKEEAIKKSAAPVGFSFGATLQKVEKFRKCNSLAKADGVTNINTKKTGPAYRGAVTDQKATEKMRGITQRLRNHMQGKFNVIQGEGQKPELKPGLKPGLSQQEIAAANNQKVDVSNYKKPTPQETESAKRKERINNQYMLDIADPAYPASIQRQKERQQEVGSPVEALRSQPVQLKAIQGGKKTEQKPTRLSPKQIKAHVEAAKQRRNAKTIENKTPAKPQQQSHLKIV